MKTNGTKLQRLLLILVTHLAAGTGCFAGGSVVAWGYYKDLNIPEASRPMYVPAGLTNVVAISGGSTHALALKSDGKVVAWGWNGNGQTNVPSTASNVVGIVAGLGASLALKNDGTVVGWGYSGYGAEIIPGGLSNVVAIARHHALKADGTVVTWGADLDGPAAVPPGLTGVIAIDDGLALKSDGTIVAWDFHGNTLSNVPPGLDRVVAMARGRGHHLALKSDGTVVAWGDNSAGQTNVPTGLTNVVSVAAGSAHSLAVKADGTVVAWGAGTNYVADYFSENKGQSAVPAGLTNAVAASGGDTFSLAIQGNGAPFVIRPLLNRKVGEGTPTDLRIAATGGGMLSYQWQFFGTNIPGATNSSLTIPETLLSHAGPYSVIVSNNLGSVSSSNVLEVVAILIASNPTDQFRFMSGDATFGVIAYGREPLAYQWKFNGVNIPDQTNRLLRLTNLQLNQAGNYSVAVSNSVGFATSGAANLSLTQVAGWGGSPARFWTVIPSGWTNIVAIAAGAQGNLVLRANGTLSAVGFDLPNNLPGFNDIIAIAAGGQYADGGCGMALRSNGTVVVWGDSRYDQQVIPMGLSNVVAITAAIGGHHCLALRSDGTVAAWGQQGFGVTDIPAGLSNATAIAAGNAHNLILKADGSLLNFGRLAAPPPDLTNVVAIAAGAFHQMALRSDGTVVAWGENYIGQTNVPSGLSNVVAISCGEAHSLALKADGTVVVWGANYDSQTNVPISLPKVRSISAGGIHSLALLEGEAAAPFLNEKLSNRAVVDGSSVYFRVMATGSEPMSYQWFFNGITLTGETNTVLGFVAASGQAGTYSVVVSNAFGAVTNSSLLNVAPLIITEHPQSQTTYVGFPQITFNVSATGLPPYSYKWQHNGIDLPSATNSTLTLSNLQLRDAGDYSVVVSNPVAFVKSTDAALQVDRVVAWGILHVPPVGTLAVASIAGSGGDSLAVTSNGNVIVWAGGVYGKTNVPVGLGNVLSVAGGDYYCLALKSNGTAVAWGNNSYGERNIPANLSNVVAIAAGGVHGLALKSDGTVAAWGDNSYHQGTVPSNVSDVVSIAAGRYHNLALKADGSVVAWGNNSSGQTKVPVFLTNVIAVAGGQDHSLALRSDGTVYAWGALTGSPPGLIDVVAIASGTSHNMALKADGSVVAWGSNTWGESNVPAWLTNVVAIAASAGGAVSVALVGDGSPLPRAAFLQAARTVNGFSASLPTQRGRVYRLEYKDSVTDGAWTGLPLVPGNGGVVTFSDSSSPLSQRFYRVPQW